MKCDSNLPWGAMIERGEVIAVKQHAEGFDLYDVKSIDRPGVIAYGLAAIGGSYSRGAMVYFFIFEDGKGRVLDMIG